MPRSQQPPQSAPLDNISNYSGRLTRYTPPPCLSQTSSASPPRRRRSWAPRCSRSRNSAPTRPRSTCTSTCPTRSQPSPRSLWRFVHTSPGFRVGFFLLKQVPAPPLRWHGPRLVQRHQAALVRRLERVHRHLCRHTQPEQLLGRPEQGQSDARWRRRRGRHRQHGQLHARQVQRRQG